MSCLTPAGPQYMLPLNEFERWLLYEQLRGLVLLLPGKLAFAAALVTL